MYLTALDYIAVYAQRLSSTWNSTTNGHLVIYKQTQELSWVPKDISSPFKTAVISDKCAYSSQDLLAITHDG
jgi:hypothetical protein